MNKMLLYIITMVLMLSSCEGYYAGWEDVDEYGEDFIYMSFDGQYSGYKDSFRSNNRNYFILGLEDSEGTEYSHSFMTIVISDGYNSRPSVSIRNFLPRAEAYEEIDYQNANTGGRYNFQKEIEPVVFDGQYYWRSYCTKTNMVLLLYNTTGSNRAQIRPNQFYAAYSVETKFITDVAFWIHNLGATMSWNIQLR